MTKSPWVLTREMFLSESEVEGLTRHLDRVVRTASDDTREAAVTDQLIILSLLYSGLRNSEFCQLQISETIVGTGEPAFRVTGTPRQNRTVFVPEFLNVLVRRYVKEYRQRESKGSRGGSLSGFLILNERGKPYERTNLYRRVVRILTAARLEFRASVQLLRHTYGYLAYKRTGGNLLFLQRQLGHVHPMVTSVYAQFVEEDYAALANTVGGETATRR